MKKVIFFILLVLIFKVNAQVPQAFSYKVLVKDKHGFPHGDKKIGLKISILQDNPDGQAVYIEKHKVNTSHTGIVDIEIGHGTPLQGLFSEIDWKNWPYFVKAELDLKCADKYNLLAVTELLSVPYAQYAGSSGNGFSGNYNDLLYKPTIPQNVSQLNNDAGFISHEEDSNPTNELQVLSISKDTIYLSQGSFVKLPNDYNLLVNKPDLSEINISKNKLESMGNQFENFDQKTNQMFNILSTVMKSQKEMDTGITRNLNMLMQSDETTLAHIDDIQGQINKLSERLALLEGLHDLNTMDIDKDGFSISKGDCDDSNPNVYPGAKEICGDGIDQDCNGTDKICGPGDVDEDKDGFTIAEGDCNDKDNQVRPGMYEICDQKDNNCNGKIDDGLPMYTYYLDSDKDGYGSINASFVTCNRNIPSGYTWNNDDCDDTNPLIKPLVEDRFNNIDDNCDGVVDETYYCPADSYEPNDNINHATYLGAYPDNQYNVKSFSGNFSNPADIDWYTIAAIDNTNFLTDNFYLAMLC